jgi:hypothetical protein
VLGKKCLLPLQSKFGSPSQPKTKGSASANQKPSFAGLEMQEDGSESSDFRMETFAKSAPHWEESW